MMFVNFKDFAGIGVFAAAITGFLVLIGLTKAAPALLAILVFIGLAVYFGNK
jgi:hypothetical protein